MPTTQLMPVQPTEAVSKLDQLAVRTLLGYITAPLTFGHQATALVQLAISQAATFWVVPTSMPQLTQVPQFR